MKTKTAFKIAATFFALGTFIFTGHQLLPRAFIWPILGLIFVLVALLINGIAVVYNIVQLIKYDQLETFYSIYILCINIPVTLLYLSFL